jgi:hypothetical protein
MLKSKIKMYILILVIIIFLSQIIYYLLSSVIKNIEVTNYNIKDNVINDDINNVMNDFKNKEIVWITMINNFYIDFTTGLLYSKKEEV